MIDRSPISDTEQDLITSLDDVAEHVHWEFDTENYIGPSTCGMASITDIDGRSKFVRRVKGLVDHDFDWDFDVRLTRNGDYRIEFPGLELSMIRNDYRNCWTLSIVNKGDFLEGPNVQRLDGQEELHRLLLNRFRENGYLTDARLTSRID